MTGADRLERGRQGEVMAYRGDRGAMGLSVGISQLCHWTIIIS